MFYSHKNPFFPSWVKIGRIFCLSSRKLSCIKKKMLYAFANTCKGQTIQYTDPFNLITRECSRPVLMGLFCMPQMTILKIIDTVHFIKVYCRFRTLYYIKIYYDHYTYKFIIEYTHRSTSTANIILHYRQFMRLCLVFYTNLPPYN